MQTKVKLTMVYPGPVQFKRFFNKKEIDESVIYPFPIRNRYLNRKVKIIRKFITGVLGAGKAILQKSDVLITVEPQVGLGAEAILKLCKRVKIKTPKHVMYLFILGRNLADTERKLTKFFIRGADAIIPPSDCESKYLNNLFQTHNFKTVRYGKNCPNVSIHDFGYVFSGGHANRDYKKVIEVATVCQQLNFVLAIGQRDYMEISKMEIPKNVKIFLDIEYSQFQKLLAESRYVFLPLKKSAFSAGQMVFIDALNFGKIVITNCYDINQEYLQHDYDSVLFNDYNEVPKILSDLEANEFKRDFIQKNAVANYNLKYSNEVHINNLLKVLSDLK